jgi:hypothetical protein
MAFGFSFGGSKSKSKTNPWGPQIPYVEGGFSQAQNLLDRGGFQGDWWLDPNNMQQAAMQGGYQQAGQAQTVGNLMSRYGQALAPSMGQAQGFQQSVLDGSAGQFSNPYASDQYNNIAGDYWKPQHQQMADNIRSETVEGLRRSDWGDAMGASLSGMGAGIESSPYVKARLAQSEQATRGYQNALSGLHMGAAGQAQQTANQWAGADMSNQYAGFGNQANAANSLMGMGQAGIGLMQGGYGMGQQGYQDQAGWGDYQGGFDAAKLQGQHAQFQAPWDNLTNYWNIIASNNWGGTTKGKTASFGFEGGSG